MVFLVKTEGGAGDHSDGETDFATNCFNSRDFSRKVTLPPFGFDEYRSGEGVESSLAVIALDGTGSSKARCLVEMYRWHFLGGNVLLALAWWNLFGGTCLVEMNLVELAWWK